jgi:hypothetical protein
MGLYKTACSTAAVMPIIPNKIINRTSKLMDQAPFLIVGDTALREVSLTGCVGRVMLNGGSDRL